MPARFTEQAPGTTRTVLKEQDSAGTVVSTVRRSLLPNGLRVITEAMPGVRSASIGVWVGTGSRDESPRLSGASHFLEHLLFKGTPTRSALEISASMDAVGGEFNAFTAREYTCFHARVLDDDLPLAVDVLGDMLCNSLLRAHDVEAEREVILDEIAMHDDDPEDVVANLFSEAAWGATPLGRPVGGTAESVSVLTRSQIQRFYRRHYTAANMVIGVAGNVDHAAVVRRVKRAFVFPSSEAAAPISRRPATPFKKAVGRTLSISRPFEQSNVILGFNAIGREDERRYALGVLSTILGGGSSSRLFQEVREERGLAYSVYSYPVHTADSGALCVGLSCLPRKLDEVLDVVRASLAALAADGVTEEELARGKGQLRGGLVLGLEDSASRMSRIAKADLLYGDLPGIDETLARIEGVTPGEVHDLARELFAQPEILAVAGPRR
ncbi:M16 family metallopeptidase [Nocardioides marmoribigeumensis]|uniref:Zn-dependent peptidase n=1 Tax=Nocardioides marmoribigeumensis TaxID=433649 RepID=A0ABU2BVJ7_9ACTN|nr:pitrilysin family protein [Nocardioides marmoribigeumensis]MDR7361384.1 putative Zn-dependent peptidase [Nocardioides marmoribigeumensis]